MSSASSAETSLSAAFSDQDAIATITSRVRDRLRKDGIDPLRRSDEARRVCVEEVRAYNDVASARGLRPVDDTAACIRAVYAEVAGYGPLQPFLDDPEVEEVWINSPDAIFIARSGVSERTSLRLSEEQVRDIVERMLHATGRRVDMANPFVDASLPGGERLHVIIPDLTRRYWSVNIRKHLARFRDLATLVRVGSLEPVAADILYRSVVAGDSILVSGATQAGKTTLLAALLGACPAGQRIVTVEETFELAVTAEDIVALQGRQPSLEGTGEVSLRRLVKEALRMRPDRLVIGEVRDAEALDLVLALNTGIPGMASLHARSAEEALVKLGALPLLAGRNIDAGFITPAIASSLQLVVHCDRDERGHRRVAEIIAPTGRVIAGRVETRLLYRADRVDAPEALT